MNQISNQEKQALLKLSQSSQVREEFRKLIEYRQEQTLARNEYTLDQYLEFLNMVNAFANHARKPFQEMKGNKFIL